MMKLRLRKVRCLCQGHLAPWSALLPTLKECYSVTKMTRKEKEENTNIQSNK